MKVRKRNEKELEEQLENSLKLNRELGRRLSKIRQIAVQSLIAHDEGKFRMKLDGKAVGESIYRTSFGRDKDNIKLLEDIK